MSPILDYDFYFCVLGCVCTGDKRIKFRCYIEQEAQTVWWEYWIWVIHTYDTDWRWQHNIQKHAKIKCTISDVVSVSVCVAASMWCDNVREMTKHDSEPPHSIRSCRNQKNETSSSSSSATGQRGGKCNGLAGLAVTAPLRSQCMRGNFELDFRYATTRKYVNAFKHEFIWCRLPQHTDIPTHTHMTNSVCTRLLTFLHPEYVNLLNYIKCV